MAFPISIAPMMDWTDRHERYFLRLISADVQLYTEMMTAQAICYGHHHSLLSYHPSEHPLVLQLGGSDLRLLEQAACIGESYGYQEINLNVGCPSPRVSSGRFGACLMLEPAHVADCIAVMKNKINIPVSIKCRLGVDNEDSYEFLHRFITLTRHAGCDYYIIHARKALLKGLSPKENREIPPLRYEVIKELKLNFPDLKVIVNGGIKTLSDIKEHLSYAEGVMIGRAAYYQPYLLAAIQTEYGNTQAIRTREEVIEDFLPYISSQLAQGTRLSAITRHLFGLFHGLPGAAHWRRTLSEQAHRNGAGIAVIKEALANVLSVMTFAGIADKLTR